MIISGRTIADDMKKDFAERIARFGMHISLGIVVGDKSPVTEKYLAAKKKFGADIGVKVDIAYGDTTNTDSFLQMVREVVAKHKAVIVQLPLPPALDWEHILNSLPADADVDVLSRATAEAVARGESAFVPPVLGAIQRVLKEGGITLSGKKIAVIGQGHLVGAPMSEWLTREGVTHEVITKETPEEEKNRILKHTDVIISGAGVPHMITAEMVKEGVTLIDAGTTVEGGSVVGDADPACAEKASLFTPVPGGIGPITVAMLYENVLRAHGV